MVMIVMICLPLPCRRISTNRTGETSVSHNHSQTESNIMMSCGCSVYVVCVSCLYGVCVVCVCGVFVALHTVVQPDKGY